MPPDAAALAAARRIVEEVLAEHESRSQERAPASPGATAEAEVAGPSAPARAERPDTPAWRTARRIVEEVLAAHDASRPDVSGPDVSGPDVSGPDVGEVDPDVVLDGGGIVEAWDPGAPDEPHEPDEPARTAEPVAWWSSPEREAEAPTAADVPDDTGVPVVDGAAPPVPGPEADRSDERPSDVARRIVAEVLAQRGDRPPEAEPHRDAGPTPADDVFPEELFATIVRPDAPRAAEREEVLPADEPHDVRPADEPDEPDDADGVREVSAAAPPADPAPEDDPAGPHDQDDPVDPEDAVGPPPIPDAARREVVTRAGGADPDVGAAEVAPLDADADAPAPDPTAPSAVAARIVAEVLAQRTTRDPGVTGAAEPATDDTHLADEIAAADRTDEIAAADRTDEMAAADRTDEMAAADRTDEIAAADAAVDPELHGDPWRAPEPVPADATRELPAATPSREPDLQADDLGAEVLRSEVEPTEEPGAHAPRGPIVAADGAEPGAGPVERTEALDPHGVEEVTEEVAVAPPPSGVADDRVTSSAPADVTASLPSRVDPWPDEMWADEVWPSEPEGDDGWTTEPERDGGAPDPPTRHEAPDRPPIVVREDGMPELTDLPPPPRRTGRWLLTTILGAIGLALLFPLAVGALLELVSLS